MIHFHGTPMTPREQLYKLAGKHFCVSFAEPRDADVCMQIGQSCLWDNGKFPAFTRGLTIDEAKLFAWLERRLVHPHRAVVLDEIGGDVEMQRAMVKRWPFPRELSWPVWHLDKPLDYLLELSDGWCGLCLGSAGPFWQIGTPKWERRMDEAFNHLEKHRAVMPWVHGLRMLGQSGNRWPITSADSVNIARNWKGAPSRGVPPRCPKQMADDIDAVQTPARWTPRLIQMDLVA